MDEILPGLWIGDLPSALHAENLRIHGIRRILSAMRGKLTIEKTFVQHQIMLDDTEDADILQYLLPSISFIQAGLDTGRGVLVHCHAGISRSATVVAAYLMYDRNLDKEAALKMIKNIRPIIEPNEGFLRQLDIFYQTQFKLSPQDKLTRIFYMDKALGEVQNGVSDGSKLLEKNMLAKSRILSGSIPSAANSQRRYIRCKMCRYELATREQMLDHGQLELATRTSTTKQSQTSPTDGPIGVAAQVIDIPKSPSMVESIQSTKFNTPSDLTIALYASPQLAALRASATSAQPKVIAPTSAPIIANPKCSGYFVEPMEWMGSFLEPGQLAGKIICPNTKCKAKLGNYDWAGVCCGCKQWVTPGFCINRSKVDEIVK